MKLVMVNTNPIQNYCPQYRSLAAIPGVELVVVFHSLKGAEPYYDPGFGVEVSWGEGLLDGFDYRVVAKTRHLGKTLRQLSPDCVVVYGYTSTIARAVWAWALKHPTKKLAYVSDADLRHERPVSLKNLVRAVLLKTIFRRVTTFLTLGDANEEFYAAHGVEPSKFVRMHLPIDPSPAPAPEIVAGARGELGIAEGVLVVLNVTKFQPIKRQQDLIAAIARTPNAHLVLAGTGSQLEECHELAKGLNNVSFLGFKQPADLPMYYSMADVYVQPSTYDHHPLSVSEAAAAGAALVVSDKTGSWGPTDDVIPGVTGLVFPVGDVTALADAFRRFVDEPELARSMGKRAQEYSRRYQALAHGGFIEGLRQHIEGQPR